MRYPASEKLEIIELVEQSSLPVGRTLASIGIPKSTFYDWYSRYQDGGIEALDDGEPRPLRVCELKVLAAWTAANWRGRAEPERLPRGPPPPPARCNEDE